MNRLELNHEFIQDHIEEFIELEDYVPFSFEDYGVQDKRDEFLKSHDLLNTMHDMDKLVNEKIDYYENPIKAYNSVLIYWVDMYSEFEPVIAPESIEEYRKIKNDENFFTFLDFLFHDKVPSEIKPRKSRGWIVHDGDTTISYRDESSIRLPDFDAIDKIYEKYGATLLADYLGYLV